VGIKQPFDGIWWAQTQSDERQGYLIGYLDCYVDDQHHALNFDKSWVEYESLITKWYSEAPSNKQRTVGRVLAVLGRPDKKALENPHADYGDEAWRQMNPLSRLGYTKGYFECQGEEPGLLHWSQSPEFYVSKLYEVYNVDDHNGYDGVEYGGSIASALAELADKPEGGTMVRH
jgi:hypothetical protein